MAGDDTADLGFALHALAGLGYRRILAEGGPQLLGELAAAELLDELCLTISPLVASGGASRIAVGTSAVQSGRDSRCSTCSRRRGTCSAATPGAARR